jgi:hypothetical protein
VLFHLFQGRGWIDKELSPGKWSAFCPWEDQHSKGTTFDTSTVVFAPRGGDEPGWFHCSHGHCEGKGLREVLALFSDAEVIQARLARGFRTIAAAEVIAQGYRTVPAEEVMPWRR